MKSKKTPPQASEKIENGSLREHEGCVQTYYEGYWIRYYEPPPDSLEARKKLIDNMARRVYHHAEEGINTPGRMLDQARAAYEAESDPGRRRVNAAMLAGCLFNHANDIFHQIVEMRGKGIPMSADSELMQRCEQCLQESFELSRNVKHRNEHFEADELWGETLKAFTFPTDEVYRSRYLKIAATLSDIDHVCSKMIEVFPGLDGFSKVGALIEDHSKAAKQKAEVMKNDPEFFTIWPRIVIADEKLEAFEPEGDAGDSELGRRGLELLQRGRLLMNNLGGMRASMPSSVDRFLQLCEEFISSLHSFRS